MREKELALKKNYQISDEEFLAEITRCRNEIKEELSFRRDYGGNHDNISLDLYPSDYLDCVVALINATNTYNGVIINGLTCKVAAESILSLIGDVTGRFSPVGRACDTESPVKKVLVPLTRYAEKEGYVVIDREGLCCFGYYFTSIDNTLERADQAFEEICDGTCGYSADFIAELILVLEYEGETGKASYLESFLVEAEQKEHASTGEHSGDQ